MANKVSVVMSIYNEPQNFIKKAIDSILSQTFRDFEFIIVCDNPKNVDLYQFLLAEQEKDNRVKILKNEVNIGLTKSLNKAIANAKGIYIARMDADDISEKNRFEEQVKFLDEHPKVGVCGSQLNYIDENDNIIGQNLLPCEKKDFPYMVMPFFGHPAVMMRKSCLLQLGTPYDEHFKYSQDFSLWYRLDDICDFYNLPRILLNYRKSANQIGQKKSSEQRHYSEEIQLSYLKKKNPTISVDWNHLDFQKVCEIREVIRKFGIADNALKKGFVALCRRINHKKWSSLLSIYLYCNKFGLSRKDILTITKKLICK